MLSLFFIKKASESFEEIDSGKIVLDEILAFLPLIFIFDDSIFSFFLLFLVDACNGFRVFFICWWMPTTKVVQISIWLAHFDHKWCFTLIPGNRFGQKPYLCYFPEILDIFSRPSLLSANAGSMVHIVVLHASRSVFPQSDFPRSVAGGATDMGRSSADGRHGCRVSKLTQW